MKKYRVTEKHPIYKCGVVIAPNKEEIINGEGSTIKSYELQFNNEFYDHVIELCISEMLENGWIEEIQEPEFTRDNVLSIIDSYKHYVGVDKECDINELINEWKHFNSKK